MRTLRVPFFLFGLVLVLAGGARADDTPQTLIDRAVKAHGGAEKLAKERGTQTKSKGTLELGGGLSFTNEISMYAGKLKEAMELDVNGQKVTVITVYDGSKAWVKANDQLMELDDKVLDEVKEASYLHRLGRLVFLKDKSVELSPLGEVKVNDRPAVGLRIVSKGHRDINLYFDKETGLMAKIERQALDTMTQQMVTEERIIQEYQVVDGMKVAKKVLVNRDGKKFMEVEVLEVKFADKIDDSEFAKP
jgi:hypothetical protein